MLGNYDPREQGFREIANSPELRAALQEVGERAKAIAVGLSQEFRITGEYVQSFDVEQTTVDFHGSYPGPRAAVRLVNRAPYAAAVEYGYEGRAGEESSSAHHVLARTLSALEAHE